MQYWEGDTELLWPLGTCTCSVDLMTTGLNCNHDIDAFHLEYVISFSLFNDPYSVNIWVLVSVIQDATG